MNGMKTVLLLGGLTILLVIIGNLVGGHNGALIALVIGGLMNFISYWFSDKIVLAMYRAKEVGETDAPELYRIVRRLSQQAQMPMPKVYIIPTDTPNAFATGRNPAHASVAATRGILEILNEGELEGVMAHELAHVQNRDILIATVAATLAGAITWIAHIAQWGGAMFGGGSSRDDDNRGAAIGMILMTILAPIAALLIQMAISRSREYAADETGARLCHKPLSLASALERLEDSAKRRPLLGGNSATASLFIVNPFRGRSFMSMFSTHPPMEKRIARLEELAKHI
jgi:heat shock protein HtpX